MRRLEIVALVAMVAFAGAALAGLTIFAERDPLLRNREIFIEMVRSPAAKSQSPNPIFEDGRTQRVPPRGTIARGFTPIRFDGVDSPANPFAASSDSAVVARGELMYRHHCAACHGATGEGDGPVAKRGYPPPPSLLFENAKKLSDAGIFRIVTEGRGNMPALGAHIAREDRWKAVAAVRQLQGQGR